MRRKFWITFATLCALSACEPAYAMSHARQASPFPSPSPSSIASPAGLVPSPTPSASPAPSPTPSFSPHVRFIPDEYYTTPAERAKIGSAGLKAAQVIQSPCFADFMSKRALIQTNNRTAAQVAAHLQALSGSVSVMMYYRCMHGLGCSSAVAYRQPPSTEIHLNRAYFTTALSDCTWASTLGHESYGHALGGYDHAFKWSPSRSYSVPYSIGGADQAQGGDAFDRCCHD